MKQEESERLLALSLDEKINQSKNVIKEATAKFGRDNRDNMAVAWTGGKDSTTMLWLYREVSNELSIQLPRCILIDEGDVFDEIVEFVERVKKVWELDVAVLKNVDVLKQVKKLGDIVRVKDLNDRNKQELKLIDFNQHEFPFEPESYVGNHLMKTVPLKTYIEENGIRAVLTAIRWDEQEARKQDDYYTQRKDPEHTRVQPILHFKERDIWNAIHKYNIPYCKLYGVGYRSLGARCSNQKSSNIPAWQQDLENTPERSGRGQDKEKIMAQLRELGYM
jgi:phosphoadenosine phosphosulfate reductase